MNAELQCRQARVLLLLAADGELLRAQAERLERHLNSCAACREEQARLQEIDGSLGDYGGLMECENPPREDARTRFLVRMAAVRPRPAAAAPWIAALVAALAAALLLGAVWMHRAAPVRHANIVTTARAAEEPAHANVRQVAAMNPWESGAVEETGEGPPFVLLPYAVPLDPDERATIVRMEISVAALRAAGYQGAMPDPGAIVKAEVVVGEDGRAIAIRVLPKVTLTGAGD